MIGVLIAAAVSVEATQARLDRLVVSCKAGETVALTAETASDVRIDLKKAGEVPSLADRQAFDCLLAGMKKMDDLQFGFLGNAAQSEADR